MISPKIKYSINFYILTNLFDNYPIIICYSKYIERKGDIIEINLIGSNCSNGRRLKKIIERVSLQNKTTVIINELNSKSAQKEYNVNMIPALVIDGKIISQGKILSDREIKKLIVVNN